MTPTPNKQKRFNIGTVKLSMEANGFPKGLILKRDLTLHECKYILRNLLGIELFTHKDCYDNEEYQDKMSEYRDTVNAWLRGNADDSAIMEFAFDCSDDPIGTMNLIPIMCYLKKKGII